MIVLTFKILLQIFAFGLALLLGGLDYWWHDKRTRRFKQARRTFVVLAVLFLLGSIGLTVFDDLSNSHKEERMRQQLSKVQEQNDGLQKGIAVLGDKSSSILTEQRNNFVSVLDEQRTIGLDTAKNIDLSASLLQSRISDGITKQEALLSQQKETLGNLTGGDTFCLVITAFPFSADQPYLFLASVGEFPLHDVNIEMTDTDILTNNTMWSKGDKKFGPYNLTPIRLEPLDHIDLTGSTYRRLSFTISTRSREFNEGLVFVKKDGKWTTGLKVSEDSMTKKNGRSVRNRKILLEQGEKVPERYLDRP